MAKIFYTDRDIEDLNNSGVRSLVVNENVVVTDLAREKAMKLGFELIREEDQAVAQVSKPTPSTPMPKIEIAKPKVIVSENKLDIEEKVMEAVMAKVGNTVDAKLLETIIKRVLKSVGST